MSLVSTTILTLDNQTLIVPNGKIWGDVIKNVTDQKARRVDMEVCVSYAILGPRRENNPPPQRKFPRSAGGGGLLAVA